MRSIGTRTGRRLLSYDEQMDRNEFLARRLLSPNAWATQPQDREAARRLFSILGHLEQIAVDAAAKGGGVEGQLDDEQAHRDTFWMVAGRLGGIEPAPESVRELQRFLDSLSGEASLACLNVVAEAWLETVFRWIQHWGPWADLMDVIGQEEARHSHEALRAARPDPDEALPLVRVLEELLWTITSDPAFVWPLAWFGGIAEVAKMGQAVLKNHREACEHLGVRPGHFAKEIAQCGRDGLQVSEPRFIPEDEAPWEYFALDQDLRQIGGNGRVRWRHGTDPLEVETRVVQAVGAALAACPDLNRVIVPQRRELYQAQDVVVGVRRLHDGLRRVMTVYVKAPHEISLPAARMRVSRAHHRAVLLPYRPPKLDHDLLQLSPPNRSAATVSNLNPFLPEGVVGETSLAPHEGATWTVCIGAFERDWLGRRYLRLYVGADHRAHNGLEVGRLATLLKAHLERK